MNAERKKKPTPREKELKKKSIQKSRLCNKSDENVSSSRLTKKGIFVRSRPNERIVLSKRPKNEKNVNVRKCLVVMIKKY